MPERQAQAQAWLVRHGETKWSGLGRLVGQKDKERDTMQLGMIGLGRDGCQPSGAGHGVPGAARRQRPVFGFRFVSNVDGADIWEATHDLDPAQTLFVVSSKTFTTVEPLTNALVSSYRRTRGWS